MLEISQKIGFRKGKAYTRVDPNKLYLRQKKAKTHYIDRSVD